MQDKMKLPIGMEDFRKLRTDDFYYVDKTMFIYDLMQYRGDVTQFTRPRRFGKTLNMDMLRCFFEIGQDASLFDGLQISGQTDLCEKYMGRFPVISISLKGAAGASFEEAESMMRAIIAKEFNRHAYVSENEALTDAMKQQFLQYTKPDFTSVALGDSIRFLSDALQSYHNSKVIILIDEYDVPLAELYGNDIPDRMERPDAEFLDTGDYLIFSLPEIGVNSEEAVQVNLKTGTWFYLGENYTVTQTPEQSSDPDSPQSENTNFLGGGGMVHVFHAEDSLSLVHWAEDDLYFYDLESGKRARKSEDGEMYLEMLPEELQTQWYPQYSCILETDGENFYAQRDFTLNRVAEDGTETPFLTLHEDWDGTELKSVFYQKLHLMQADKLFVLASGIPKGSETEREIPLIMDVRTGQYEYLINQEEPNSWGYGKCTDDCIYLISDIGSQLREYRISEEGCTQTTIMLSQNSDFSINLSYVSGSRDRWLIGEDGKLWFVYQNAWCCAELDETKDNFLKKQVISETIPYGDTNTIVKSTGKMLTYVSKDNSNMGGLYKGLQISNYDGSDAQILVPDDRSCILLGSYCDNGVYHIALTEIAGTTGNPQTVFLTKDGISISSVGVKDAE